LKPSDTLQMGSKKLPISYIIYTNDSGPNVSFQAISVHVLSTCVNKQTDRHITSML